MNLITIRISYDSEDLKEFSKITCTTLPNNRIYDFIHNASLNTRAVIFKPIVGLDDIVMEGFKEYLGSPIFFYLGYNMIPDRDLVIIHNGKPVHRSMIHEHFESRVHKNCIILSDHDIYDAIYKKFIRMTQSDNENCLNLLLPDLEYIGDLYLAAQRKALEFIKQDREDMIK